MRQENTYRMLKKMGLNVYQQQDKIQIIHMKSGCIADVSKFTQGCVSVTPDEKTIAENTMLQTLRALKSVVLPDGLRKIGDRWFANSDIESVVIPASVREIGAEAFFMCERLRRVVFAEGSKLEKMGNKCF